MNFSIPSASRYITGLAIIAAISLILYFVHDSLNLANLHPMTILIAGLLVGHLIGSIIQSSKASQHAPSSSARSQNTAAQAQEKQTLYVGNIAYNASRRDLEKLFSHYGKVHSARIMLDRETRKSRGYGFIEMDINPAKHAVTQLNGFEFKGRSLKVNVANDKGQDNN